MKKAGNIIRWIIVAALLVVVVYEAVMIYRDQKEYAIADNEYGSITGKYVRKSQQSADETDDSKEEAYAPDLDIDYDALLEENPDFIGWLYFPATGISYPVVKEKTIDEYIHKTFEGKINKAGCIFMDVLSNSNFKGYSDMVFGHNMKNGSMFGALKSIYKNKEKDILADDPYIYVYTADGVRRYRVFAYYHTTEGSESYTEVKTEDDYDSYISYIRKQTVYNIPSDISFDEHSSLLTLSTCSGESGSGKRFVVHGIFIDNITKKTDN